MIRPPGFAGAAFGTAETGDLRVDEDRRHRVSAELGIEPEWAYVNQVHGRKVVKAEAPGTCGDADALFTTERGLPLTVATADCVPIIVEAETAVAVIHAGWRGAAAGVVTATLEALQADGHRPRRAAIGPAIGPCCYEVGPEVVAQFPGFAAKTTWNTPSVDVPGFVAKQLAGLELWQAEQCTFTSQELYSWREDQTKQRQVAVAWLPST